MLNKTEKIYLIKVYNIIDEKIDSNKIEKDNSINRVMRLLEDIINDCYNDKKNKSNFKKKDLKYFNIFNTNIIK